MFAEFAVLFFGLFAKWLELLVVVENVGEALLLPGRRLGPGLLRRVPSPSADLAESAAELLEREPCTGLADRHRVEVGVVVLIVRENGLAGSRQSLGRLAPFGPSLETDNGNAELAGLTLKSLVRLHMTRARSQITLVCLARHGLVVMVLEKLPSTLRTRSDEPG